MYLNLLQGLGIGGMIFWATMFGGAIYLRGKNDVAREKRKRICKSLGALAVTQAKCWTPTAFNTSTDVVLLLTRNTCAVYSTKPFVKGFECPLSNIVETVTRKDNPSLSLDSIEITFSDQGKHLVGRFHRLHEMDGEEWAAMIAALR